MNANTAAQHTARGTVLVTGATGFIGSAVVRTFLAGGYEVRTLVRHSSSRRNLQGLDVQIFEGDVRHEEDVARALDGARYLVHCAADYRLWARRSEEIYRNNVVGTTAVVRVALRSRIERMVYTSSVATLALNANGMPADETRPLAERDAVGAYKRSKIAAEKVVCDAIDQGLQAVVVHPTAPVGPRDIKPTPTGRIVIEASSGRMPAYVDTGLNLVHVDDVAAGHLQALQFGKVGDRYILGGQDATLAQMLEEIACLRRLRGPRFRLPRPPLFPLAAAAELVAWLTGREPFMTIDGLRMSKHRMFFTSAKARRELGYRARPYTVALQDAIDWFVSADYLR